MASISFRHVNKTYPGNVTVVPDLNLEIQDKEFVILVGVTTVGVSSGASAPEELVSELLEILRREKFELVKS